MFIFLCGKLGIQQQIYGAPIAAAAESEYVISSYYSASDHETVYNKRGTSDQDGTALPIILEKILFLFIVTLVVFFYDTTPLVGMLMLGNLLSRM